MRRNQDGQHNERLPTERLQYGYTSGSGMFITIPESVGYIKLLIDNFSIPLNEKRELLVTLIEQNPELVRGKLSIMRKELGNSGIFDRVQLSKTELHVLLSGIDDDGKVDKLFKEISNLDTERIWREQKNLFS
ncbi:hypothetical protein [Wolbachia pipientis]|uniref:hypothetical protein n=1 Tax=Wolbachia pipientis TaxID=955 RepID=UPI0025A44534|nr:hypothetical protein [Wolbachia pipientis]MDM8335392.1 hypothetical protein [Wolbachia pipientis]